MRLRSLFLILIGLLGLALSTIPAAAEETGSIFITSDPEEAEVYITNQFRGYTPLKIDGIRAGMTRITLKKPTFQNWNGVIYVVDSATTDVHPVLAKTGAQFRTYGSIVVTAVPGATVLQNVDTLHA